RLSCAEERRAGVLAMLPMVWPGVAAVLYGVTLGAAASGAKAVGAVAFPHYYGTGVIGSLRGLPQAVAAASTAVAQLLLSLGRDLADSYLPALLALAGLPALVALAAPFARLPVRPAAQPRPVRAPPRPARRPPPARRRPRPATVVRFVGNRPAGYFENDIHCRKYATERHRECATPTPRPGRFPPHRTATARTTRPTAPPPGARRRRARPPPRPPSSPPSWRSRCSRRSDWARRSSRPRTRPATCGRRSAAERSEPTRSRATRSSGRSAPPASCSPPSSAPDSARRAWPCRRWSAT